MSYKRTTGGSKEFYYTKEDSKRIESEDTESTKEFKKELKKWREETEAIKRKIENKKMIARKNKIKELIPVNKPSGNYYNPNDYNPKRVLFLEKLKKIIKRLRSI